MTRILILSICVCLGGCNTLPAGWGAEDPANFDSVTARAASLCAKNFDDMTFVQQCAVTAGRIGAATSTELKAAGVPFETRIRQAVKAAETDAERLYPAVMKGRSLGDVIIEALEYTTGTVSQSEAVLGMISGAQITIRLAH